MKSTESKGPGRPQLVSAIVQAYMDLFVMMQFNAVSHWLMLELTFAQARALIILAAQKALTVSQLAKMLGVGNSTASILVQQLVERGLVTRREHEADRRRMVVSLSEKGAEIGTGRRREREKQWRRWLSHLSDDELNALASGLSALTNVMQRESKHIAQQTTRFGPTLDRASTENKTL
jgi:DNA-binding MarR family transcriptional regulator